MTGAISAELYLFVPADRPERYAKAMSAGADAVVVDLEDAVSPQKKEMARDLLVRSVDRLAAAPCPVVLRVNAAGTEHHSADIEVLRRVPFAGVMLAKAERPDDVGRLAAASGLPVLALVESARGLVAGRSIAQTAARLVFGSIDYAADLGCGHTREALLAARSELVLASRLSGSPAPVDGVTTAVLSADIVEDDMRYAVGLGMGGKLLIHPAQVAPARSGLAPTRQELDWAERVLAVADRGATTLDGTMVDAPVRLRAESLLRRCRSETA